MRRLTIKEHGNPKSCSSCKDCHPSEKIGKMTAFECYKLDKFLRLPHDSFKARKHKSCPIK